MNQQPDTDTLLQLCLLDNECPHVLNYVSRSPHWGPPLGYPAPHHPCGLCGSEEPSTGRVYILDPNGNLGLRIHCPHDRGSHNAHTMAGWFGITEKEKTERPSCCQGRGWTPSQDPWLYVRAAWPFLNAGEPKNSVIRSVENALWRHTDPGSAALAVVIEVLLGEEKHER